MDQSVYEELLKVMQSRRGPYAGLDIPEFFDLVKELFTPEEAMVNNILGKKPEPLEQIAPKSPLDPKTLSTVLEGMADKGLCATFVKGGERVYQGLPFMPGIMEYQFLSGRDTERDRNLAHLIHAYQTAYEAAKGVTKIKFPLTRVIPVDKTIEVGNQIHTYDQVATYIQKNDSIGVGTCYCRHAAKLRGEDTHDMPMNVCMWFGHTADYIMERLGGRKVTKEEALAILDQSEDAGLIHMSRNTAENIEFLCNCDRWHCEVVTQVLKQPKPGAGSSTRVTNPNSTRRNASPAKHASTAARPKPFQWGKMTFPLSIWTDVSVAPFAPPGAPRRPLSWSLNPDFRHPRKM